MVASHRWKKGEVKGDVWLRPTEALVSRVFVDVSLRAVWVGESGRIQDSRNPLPDVDGQSDRPSSASALCTANESRQNGLNQDDRD